MDPRPGESSIVEALAAYHRHAENACSTYLQLQDASDIRLKLAHELVRVSQQLTAYASVFEGMSYELLGRHLADPPFQGRES